MDMYDAKSTSNCRWCAPRRRDNPHHRRSYLANFITKDVNKMVNLCLLKHHQSAGVTVALKNLSHGLVNNVSRSHSTSTLNTCGTFIPSIVDHPIIRRKVVLNILDGLVGGYHGGPGGKIGKYMWDHKTMYFSTDPVAMDKVALRAIDAKRAEVGMKSIAEGKPDPYSSFLNLQVEQIETWAHSAWESTTTKRSTCANSISPDRPTAPADTPGWRWPPARTLNRCFVGPHAPRFVYSGCGAARTSPAPRPKEYSNDSSFPLRHGTCTLHRSFILGRAAARGL